MEEGQLNQPSKENKVTVYYDGSCPSCVRDRKWYEKLSGKNSCSVDWFDITEQDEALSKLGIDPELAMKELHVKTENNQILSEMDAYILLMDKTLWLKPFAWILRLRPVNFVVAKIYHHAVHRRLKRTGRI